METINLKGPEYLKQKLRNKKSRVDTRYKYYEMKNTVKDFGISTPPKLRGFSNSVGWCAKAVDSLSDRIVFKGFREDYFDLTEIYKQNNQDVLIDSIVNSTLIAGCSFIYISQDENGTVHLQSIDGAHATGLIDPVTYLLKEGYAVLAERDDGTPITEAYFEPYKTTIFQNGIITEYENIAPYPLLVPVVYRPDSKRPFGHSRISRACMSAVDSVLRTLKRGEISAEFYSVPQKYISGLSDEEEFNKWEAAMSAIIAFGTDEEGKSPTVGQFTQQSMTPHLEMMKSQAQMFAGETGLTLDDLGIPSSNPASYDAIKASHESLRLTAKKAQRTIAVGLINAGYLAACLRDGATYYRDAFSDTEVKWAPLFEADAASLSAVGDGILKINQAIPGAIDQDKIEELTGL